MLSEVIKRADWKSEKHVPVIEAPETVKAGEFFNVKASIGRAVAHPNTTEHHIRWIALYFLPEGATAPFQVAQAEFTAHGESVAGANQGPVFTGAETTASLKLTQSGTLLALSYCNIHGLWESSQAIRVEA